jgi:hypothetical protein
VSHADPGHQKRFCPHRWVLSSTGGSDYPPAAAQCAILLISGFFSGPARFGPPHDLPFAFPNCRGFAAAAAPKRNKPTIPTRLAAALAAAMGAGDDHDAEATALNVARPS